MCSFIGKTLFCLYIRSHPLLSSSIRAVQKSTLLPLQSSVNIAARLAITEQFGTPTSSKRCMPVST